MIIGATLAVTALKSGIHFSYGIIGVIMFPLVARAFGIIASIAGIMTVRLNDEENQDPMSALNRGFLVCVALSMVFLGGACYFLLNSPEAPNAWWHFFLSGILGVLASLALVYITQYYTEDRYRPVKSVVEASKTGPATNIISGLAVGLESTALPVIVMSAALLGSYYLGRTSGIDGGGIFGTAVATMGMLISAGYVLAMDTFGPITDNAGGIVEMSNLPEEVRRRTDRLDAVGNTTKALTKGYAIGSAGLAAFLLFQAYIDEVIQYAGLDADAAFPVDLSRPVIFVGGLFGATLVFFFTSLALRAVGRAAQSVIGEVRRQFAGLSHENGIIHFPHDFVPDYRTCVDIVTTSALKEMIWPGLLVVLAPITVGILFRAFIGPGEELISAQAVAAMLMVGTIAGILMALFLNNAGGAWDNAKKSIESRVHDGKYIVGHDGKRRKNPTHGAAVVGDTVGDPFKDTAGPSLHVLIKLLATLALVLAPLFL
jgi:K(+)-stimulated pyrophosphate-energized sodium pump